MKMKLTMIAFAFAAAHWEEVPRHLMHLCVDDFLVVTVRTQPSHCMQYWLHMERMNRKRNMVDYTADVDVDVD
jgi:hypothetical protein